MKAAVQESPAESDIELANWNWKVVRHFVSERFGISLSRNTCLNYLHRLGFVLRRPKKRLVKEDGVKRESFVAEYAVRIRVARGLYYRPSTFRSRPIEWEETIHADTGMLDLTTRHIYFAGSRKRFRVRYDRIVTFDPHEDGSGIKPDAQTAKR